MPTLEALSAQHDVALVVSQPERPAGRGRSMTPTPIASWAREHALASRMPSDVNDPAEIGAIHGVRADAFVVIAFGQKLSTALLEGAFAINLHASLLPAYRGAAPINWAMIDGCAMTGVSVIALAQRMDAGVVFATRSTLIDPSETAGELHDRLARLGPDAIMSTLEHFAHGTIEGIMQDESTATKARKLSKDDGRIDLSTLSAFEARCRIHGLSPWPGCDVSIGGSPTRLLRVREHEGDGEAGSVQADTTIACRTGRLEVLELQPHGGKPMSLAQYRNGRSFDVGTRVTQLVKDGVP